MRYGLRRQLILNLGLVMLLSSLLLSFFAMHMAQLRFARDRTRYLRTVSEQIDQIVVLMTELESNKKRELPWWSPHVQMEGALWPSDAALVFVNGKIRPLMGLPPSDLHLRIRIVNQKEGKTQTPPLPVHPPSHVELLGLPTKENVYWSRHRLGQRIVWERYRTLWIGKRVLGTLWLRWDISALRREFYSYQGLLFLYLMVFCVLILVVVMFFLEGRLVRPINRLGEAITELAQGEMTTDLAQEVSRRDQIGALAQSFLTMRDILYHQAVERENHILELESANQALERAQQELVQREKLATLGSLAAGVAHEVGNPLSAIMGYSDLLRVTHEWGEMERDLAERIYRETQRIDRIIRDLLDYARPVSQDKPGDPIHAVKEALELLRLQKRFRDMNIEKQWPESVPLVRLAESYLIQVLINLFLNASDACEGKGTIWIRIATAHPCVVIEVSDNGPGVPTALRNKLFEPFFSTKDPGKGVGLGLALCRRLVVEAGGRIEVADADEGGAKFIIALPFFREEREPPPALDSNSPERKRTHSRDHWPTISSLKHHPSSDANVSPFSPASDHSSQEDGTKSK